MENMENESLYHHGILGMKWGVRRTPQQLGHKTASGGSKKVKNTKAGKTSKPKRKISEMSDEELNAKVRRLRLENEARFLEERSRNSNQIDLAALGKEILVSTIKQATIEAGKQLLSKQLVSIGDKAVSNLKVRTGTLFRKVKQKRS